MILLSVRLQKLGNARRRVKILNRGSSIETGIIQMKTKRLKIGVDIVLDKGERLITYRNKINGSIVYSTSKSEKTERDGKVFVTVFEKPVLPNLRRNFLMSLDALERIHSRE